MKSFLTLLFTGIVCHVSFSQGVGLGTTLPHASAMLDMASTTKGVLLPRVALTSLTDNTTVPYPAASLLLYNTNAALNGGTGFFYNSGNSVSPQWVRLSTAANGGLQLPYSGIGSWGGNAFSVTNNSAVSPNAAISGGCVNGNAIVGVTGSGRGVYGSSSGTGAGVYAYAQTASGTALNVYGRFKVEGTTPIGAGKVLTSDAAGFATWQGGIAFSATGILAGGSANIAMTETKIAFAAEDYDLGSDYSGPSAANHSVFTAPDNGIYHFEVQVTWDAGNYVGGGSLTLYRKQFNTYTIVRCMTTLNKNFPASNISIDVKLNAGEEVYATCNRSTPGAVSLLPQAYYCYFTGRQVVKL